MKGKMIKWMVVLSVACWATGVRAQTTKQMEAYKAMVQGREQFNHIQQKAGMPEMKIPSFEDWKKEEAKKARSKTTPANQNRLTPQERWAKKMLQVKPHLCRLVPVGKKTKSSRSIKVQKEKARLLKVAAEACRKQPEIERKLDAIAKKHGVKRREKNAEGKVRILAGEMDGYPIWIESYNQIAAAGISADELWPTNSAPWSSSSTGRNLTGTNVVIGMWEAEGGTVNTNHQEFAGRVVQMDGATNLTDHATGVAGTIAGAGKTISLPGIPSGEIARGVAFNALIDAYDLWGFNSEIINASAGTTNFSGIRLSNHSWGLTPAWNVEYIDTYYYNGAWYSYNHTGIVWGNNPNFVEDPLCGYYLSNSDGTGSKEVDALMSTNAPRHLLVYAAGNNRFYGPGHPVSYFYRYQNHWVLVFNPSAGNKDWALGDGDTYGFDTVMAPGTAKNVLTVGSVKDVWHTENGQLVWGYASNTTIHVSSFSNCGPTDDGRIKPDVMAVGEADSTVRSYGIVTPISTATDSYTTNYSGTSFSAPSVTGGLGLCEERRVQLFPNLDSETDDLLNSSLKALAIHTADDIMNPGPDYLTGWGLFNTVSAVNEIELDAHDGRGTHIKELELSVGETNSWIVYLDGSSFKATLAWSDLPGNPTGIADDPTPMLVNNLDLWIENEDGTQTFLPWVLNPDLQQEREVVRNTPATTGYDDRNNVEQVAIATPTAGYYKICVAHAGGINGQTPSIQKLSILTSGDTPLQPKIATFEQSPTNGTFLLQVACDPGAHMILESTENLTTGNWQTNGTFLTQSNTNALIVSSSAASKFWRVRRETGAE